jgi:hypothetical protein
LAGDQAQIPARRRDRDGRGRRGDLRDGHGDSWCAV